MEHMPVSVVIPTYNRANLIPRAVCSALAATRSGDEIIVIDDGSTDNTQEVLAPYLSRIRYVRIPNGGAGTARNRGIKEAQYPLIAFLDSDDEWMPWKLELQRSVMQAYPNVVFTFSDFSVRDIDGRAYPNYLINWHHDHRSWDEILGPGTPFSSITNLPQDCPDFQVHLGDLYFPLMRTNYAITSSVVANKQLAGSALQFGAEFKIHEDWVCFGQMARRGPVAYLNCDTIWQHGHTGPRVSDAGVLQRQEDGITILERLWGSDRDFLAQHAEGYHEELKIQRIDKAKTLIAMGRLEEARREFCLIEGGPLFYRMLAYLPTRVVCQVLKYRRVLNGASRANSSS